MGNLKINETAKRILAIIFIVSMLLPIFNLSTRANSTFDKDYFDIVVQDLKARGIFVGYPDGTMGEDKPVTRVEMATVCTRLLGVENIPNYTPKVNYPDVPNTHWAVKYVSLTNDYGVTQGYPDGLFKPENNVTLNEALKMILVSGGYGTDEKGNVLSYPDGYIKVGSELGVTDRITYEGNRAALRGEIMVMAYQMLQAGDDYVVKFDLNYNNPQGAIPDQIIKKGGFATRPTTENVKRENNLLTGWYTDKNCKNEFSFDTKINANITLFAKWIAYDDSANSYYDTKQINDMLIDIERKYYNNNDYVDFKDFGSTITEIVAYVQYLYEQGKILEYEYIKESNTVVITQKNGDIYGFEPHNDELLSGGNDIQIKTYSRVKEPMATISRTLRNKYSVDSDDYVDTKVDFEALKNLSGDIILWYGHGGFWGEKISSILTTGVKWTDETEKDSFYINAKNNGWIVKGSENYCITYKFINSEYLGNNCFNGALIYLNTCNSLYRYDNEIKLATAFMNKGARVVIGNSDVAVSGDSKWLMQNIIDELIIVNNSNDDFLYTVGEAINSVKLSDARDRQWNSLIESMKADGIDSSGYNKTDVTWCYKEGYKDYKLPFPHDSGIEGMVLGTEFNEFLMGVTVTLYHQNNPTVPVASGTTDIMGMFKIYCPMGNYNMKFEKEGYVTKTENLVSIPQSSVVQFKDPIYLEKKPIPPNEIHISNANILTIDWTQSGKDYKLIEDIYLTAEWIPIEGFRGTFDGRGHSINNLYILESSNRQEAGLFKRIVENGVIMKNVTINIGDKGITAYSSSTYNSFAGGLVGYNNSAAIENCYVTGNISAKSSAAESEAGGVVGRNYGTIENCSTTGNVSAYYAGGLVGDNRGTIKKCYSTGNISGSHAGGLVGFNGHTIESCYATGNVSAESSGSSYAGGLIGSDYSGTVKNCYATGNVSASANASSSRAGGLIGYNSSITIENCYRLSTQKITGNRIDESGTSLTSAEMKDKNNFTNWDFNSIWAIDSSKNNGYPYLR